MKIRHRIFVVCIGFLSLCGATGIVVLLFPGLLPHPLAETHDSFSNAELALLSPGDLILRKGVGTPSDLIVTFLNDGTGLSHCALVLEANENRATVVHCINKSLSPHDGVQIQDLSEFNHYSRPESLIVVRPRVNVLMKDLILKQARMYMQSEVPFDNGYNLSDHSAFYCSELLVCLFESTGWWQKGENGQSPNYRFSGPLLSFRTFLNPAFFDIVLSHNVAATAAAKL